jgi:Flp pilus assembly protein TadG
VEFAIVAIPFLLFVFSVLEFGNVILMQHLVTNATREGARLVSLNTDVNGDDSNMSPAEIQSEITAALAGRPLNNLAIDIRHLDAGVGGWTSSATFQHRIAVEVSGDYVPITPLLYLISGGSMNSIPVSATAIAYSEGH